MRPVLFSFHAAGRDLALPAYGAVVAIGFALGIVAFVRAGKRAGLDGARLQDLAFAGVVFGLLGARAAFVLVNARAFVNACVGGGGPGGTPAMAPQSAVGGFASGDCWSALRIWQGGLVFYGGVAAVVVVVAWFCRRERWSFSRLGDLAALPVALGHGIGRLGCFLAGCCYGKVCAAWWGIAFPRGSIAFDDHLASGRLSENAGRTLPLHPTQLYEAAGELLIAAILWRAQRRARARSPQLEGRGSSISDAPPPGSWLVLYGIAYAALRFVIELFRGDPERGFVWRRTFPRWATALGLPTHEPLLLSVSQAASVVALIAGGAAAGLATYHRHRRRALPLPDPAPALTPSPRRAPGPRTPAP